MKKIFLYVSLISFHFVISQVTLTSFNPNIAHTHFGSALDTFGNEIVATASNTTFMTQSNVFVFEKTASGIVQETYFTPSDGVQSDYFGTSVAINNDFIAVGSPYHNQVATFAGAIYLYRKVSGNWQFFQKIVAFDGIADDRFGTSVKLHNNQLFVSSLNNEPIGQPTTANNGAVYVYNFNGTNWVFSQKITVAGSSQFGRKIKIENNTMVILSSNLNNLQTYMFDGSNWNFLNNLSVSLADFDLDNNQLFVLDSNTNSMIIYENVSNSWTTSTTLTSLNFGGLMPTNFELKDNILLVTLGFHALLYTSPTPVSYYRKISGNWIFQQFLNGNGNPSQDDYFGSRIAITNDLVVIGANNENYGLPTGKVYFVETALGIDENAINEIALYPNPTTGNVFLSQNTINEIDSVEIYQLDGKLISIKNQFLDAISLSEFQNGIYLLKFNRINGSSFTKKIVKI